MADHHVLEDHRDELVSRQITQSRHNA